MKVSIIIPFHNEVNTLSHVFEELSKISFPGITLEKIFINDGSTDGSEKVIKKLLKNSHDKSIQYVLIPQNQGKGAAIKKGLEKATGEYIIIQDADMEYHPKYIPSLIEPIQTGRAEVVFGTRLKRLPNFLKYEKTPRFALHYFGNRFLSLLTSILYGAWVTDMETGYKLFPAKAIPHTSLSAKSFDIEPEITAKLLKGGYKIVEIPITTEPRGYKEGKKLHTVKDGIAALKALILYRFRE